MSEIAGLIREFPVGSLVLLLALLWATERVLTTLINRNKPVCKPECCNDTLVDTEVCEDDSEDDHEPRHGHK